eukprot:2525031-Amphidinium_carterae.3
MVAGGILNDAEVEQSHWIWQQQLQSRPSFHGYLDRLGTVVQYQTCQVTARLWMGSLGSRLEQLTSCIWWIQARTLHQERNWLKRAGSRCAQGCDQNALGEAESNAVDSQADADQPK